MEILNFRATLTKYNPSHLCSPALLNLSEPLAATAKSLITHKRIKLDNMQKAFH